MKKQIITIFSICLMSLLLSCSEDKVAEADIHFFYLELCPSCDEYVMAEELAESVIQLGGKSRNIIHDDDAVIMRDLLTEKKLADISHSLPLLIMENEYFVGYEEISAVVDSLENNQ